jgi:hypothetical protein
MGLVAGMAATATAQAIALFSARRRVRIRHDTKMVTLVRNLKQEQAAALFECLMREQAAPARDLPGGQCSGSAQQP